MRATESPGMRSRRSNNNLWRRLLAAALTLATVAGCGGGGGDDGEVVAQNAVAVPQQPAPQIPQAPTNKTLNFSVQNFGPTDSVMVVSNFTPTGELDPDGTLDVTTSNRVETDDELLRCATPELLSQPIEAPKTELYGKSTGGTLHRFQELPEGAQRDFFVTTSSQTITAQKVLEPGETVHCTIFAQVVGGNPILSRDRALEIAMAWDTENPAQTGDGIYNQVRAAFGSEWTDGGGADGDSKVVLLFLNPDGLGSSTLLGFFNPIDANPRAQNAQSNEAEILYVNSERGLEFILGTLAHEFQHMLNHNAKVYQQGTFPAGAVAEVVAINEGLSVLSEQICGFSLEAGNNTFIFAVVQRYLINPGAHSFFNFFEVSQDYGQGYLFFRYVMEHFGVQTVRNIASSTGVGLANLDQNLPGGFAEIFRRWTVANHATNIGGPVPDIYRYPSGFRTDGAFPLGSLPGVRFETIPANGNVNSANLKAWSAQYGKVEGGDGTALGVQVVLHTLGGAGLVVERPGGTFSNFQNQ